MAALTFAALEKRVEEMQKQFAEFATKNHYDAFTYTFKEAAMRVSRTPNPKWIAIVTIKLSATYNFDDDPFEDDYVFKYAVGSDGSIGRYDPNTDLEEAGAAYETWGGAVIAWIKTVQGNEAVPLRPFEDERR